jgi:hypothetical protein
MVRTTVPVTAVDEDRHARPDEHEIRRAPQGWDRSGADAVPQAQRVHRSTNRHLRHGIPAMIASHYTGDGGGASDGRAPTLVIAVGHQHSIAPTRERSWPGV